MQYFLCFLSPGVDRNQISEFHTPILLREIPESNLAVLGRLLGNLNCPVQADNARKLYARFSGLIIILVL